MSRLILPLVVAALVSAGGFGTHAQAQSVRRQTQVAVSMKKSKPSPEEKGAAIASAKLALLREHIQSAEPARQANLKRIQPQLEQQPDAFLSNVSILAENVDAKARTYTVALVANVNESVFDHLLGADAPPAQKNPISLLVVSRRQTSVKEIGPKVATGTTELKTANDSADQQTQNGQTTVAQSSKTQTGTVTESAVTSTADSITYDVASSQEVDAAISSVLSVRGFKVVPAEVLADMTEGLFDKKRFVEDFKTGNDIAPETKRNAVKGCQKVEMPFFGYGTLTVGVKQKDDVSGKWKVNVSIIAEVWDVREKFPSKAAAVGPVQYAELGDSQTQAENNALSGAAARAAQLVCDQLLQKGIR